MRKCKPFKQTKPILCLYNAFVLSKLNFACVVWSPRQRTFADRLEGLQDRFVKYISLKQQFVIPNDNVTLARAHFHLMTLADRRVLSDILFLFKTLNSIIQSPEVLAEIGFNVPQRSLRANDFFYIPFKNTFSAQSSPICRIMKHGNMFTDIDYFHMTLNEVKKNIKNKFVP